MDLNLDSNAAASEDWLTIAIRDAIEAEASVGTYPASQDVERPGAPVGVLPTDTTALDNVSTSNLFQTGDVPIGTNSAHYGAFHGAAGLDGYEQASPSLQILATELNGFQSEDEVEYESSELDFYENLPSDGVSTRKNKKHAPMNAEQQETTMLQIEAQLRKFDDYEQATKPNKTMTYPQQSTVKQSSEIPETSSLRADSPLSHLSSTQSPPPKTGPKRGRGNLSEKTARKRLRRQKKDINPETLNVLSILFELRKPFEEKLHTIVDYARTESINKVRQDDTSIPLEELQKIEAEWKAEHAVKLNQMTVFLERFGLIPLGGVEATGLGHDTLA